MTDIFSAYELAHDAGEPLIISILLIFVLIAGAAVGIYIYISSSPNGSPENWIKGFAYVTIIWTVFFIYQITYLFGEFIDAYKTIRAMKSDDQQNVIKLIDTNKYAHHVLHAQKYKPDNLIDKIRLFRANSYSNIYNNPDERILEYAIYSGDIWKFEQAKEYFHDVVAENINIGVNISITDKYKKTIRKYNDEINVQEIERFLSKTFSEKYIYLYEESKHQYINIIVNVDLVSSNYIVVHKGLKYFNIEGGAIPYVSGYIYINGEQIIAISKELGQECVDQFCTIASSIEWRIGHKLTEILKERFRRKFNSPRIEVVSAIDEISGRKDQWWRKLE